MCCKITIIITGDCKDMPASQTGSYTIHIDAASGNPLTLTPPSGALTAGQVGVQVTEEVTSVSGGTPPYSFSVSSGAVPDGLSLNSVENPDGTETVNLEGTPTTAGDFSFDLMVTDSAAATATAKVTTKKKIK